VTTGSETAAVIAQVGKHQLTLRQLQWLLPDSLRKDDSVAIANKIVRQWIEEILLTDSISETTTEAVAQARLKAQIFERQLLIQSYQQQWLNKHFDTVISPDTLQAAYQLHAAALVTQKPLYRFRYVVSPVPETTELLKSLVSARGYELAMQWCKNRNATLYWDTTWVGFDQLRRIQKMTNKKLISEINDKPNKEKEKENKNSKEPHAPVTFKYQEEGKTGYHIFYLVAMRKVGQPLPIELATPYLRELILSRRSQRLLEQHRTALFEKAIQTGKAQILK
jgi:hypothetical protein